jgi:hypothetical protein
MVSIDGRAHDAQVLLYAPPPRKLPPWVHPVDGSLAGGEFGGRYDRLLRLFAQRHTEDLESQDSFGWRNWGDYQIGTSYINGGQRYEDWANLQYDLPFGLLLAWLRTGDPTLWRYGQASVRHLMDIDLVKFSPYGDKLNGLVYRKGEMARPNSHVSSEPIVDQAFAFRSLLLYHALTGEAWARDLAKQSIERLAWYAARGSFIEWGDRPLAWMLRGVLAGAQHFRGESSYDFAHLADTIVDGIMRFYRKYGQLPGIQPVWQGQLVEGLIQYYELTHRLDVRDVIISHARYLVSQALRRRSDGEFEYLYCFGKHGRVTEGCATAEWSSEYNYGLLWLSSIAYAYSLTKDPALARAARDIFAQAEARLATEGSTRVWSSALGFPHLFLEVFAKP